MIVEIRDELFQPQHAEDLLLGVILRQGMHGRYGVRTKPAFREHGSRAVNGWLERQSPNTRETAVKGLRRGLEYTARLREPPRGRREPQVILELRDEPSWPRSFDDDAVRLPLGPEVELLLSRPLRLKLENEIGDWAFLQRVVPPHWRRTWARALRYKWLDPDQGGGQSELRRVVEELLPLDHSRRLRTWAMFDSDATAPGRASEQAEQTRAACLRVGVPHHMLERRKIENYVPEAALRAWVERVLREVERQSNKTRDRDAARRLAQAIDAYWRLPAPERHYHELKAHDRLARKFALGAIADIWRGDSESSSTASRRSRTPCATTRSPWSRWRPRSSSRSPPASSGSTAAARR